MSIKMQPSI